MRTPGTHYRSALPEGYTLQWYRLGHVLGQGGFGITYRAHDVNLNRTVAIKEYLPSGVAAREDGQTVKPASDDVADEFSAGLRTFINEAQTLARFGHPNIVHVYSVFEDKGTAYMVMQYEEGDTLANRLKLHGTLGQREILQLAFPLLSGLEAVHNAGFIHRDIKPANVFIREDNAPVLLDFGSARQAIQSQTRELTNLVTGGYAPIEQYTGKSDKQGPWTDIYGLGATFYRAITGHAPNDALERGESLLNDATDPYQCGTERVSGHYHETLLKAIDHALQFRASDRPQSVAEWREELAGIPTGADQNDTIAPESVNIGDTQRFDPSMGTRGSDPATRDRSDEFHSDATVCIDRSQQTFKSGVRLALDNAQRIGERLNLRIAGIVAALVVAIAIVVFVSNGKDAATARSEPNETALQAPILDLETSAGVLPLISEDAGPEALAAGLFDADGTLDGTFEAGLFESGEAGDGTLGVEPWAAGEAAGELQPGASGNLSVAQILAAAAKDVAAFRLTTPANKNAYAKYQNVLSIEPGNEAALAGIRSIADRYTHLSYRDLDNGKFDRAERYMQKAQSIVPDAQRLTNFEQTLLAKRSAMAERVAEAPESPAKEDAVPVVNSTGRDDDVNRANSFLRRIGSGAMR